MRIFSVLLVISLLIVDAGHAKEIRAKTESGSEVILKEDGTWHFSAAPKRKPNGMQAAFTKSQASTSVHKGKGTFSVWYNPAKWELTKSKDISKATFHLKNEDLYGMLISERISMSLENLKELALKIALEAAPDAKLIFEENRVVNGNNVACLKMEGTIQGIQFVYYGYYFAGDAGTFQLITYTSKNLYKEYEAEMTEFLNGMVVN